MEHISNHLAVIPNLVPAKQELNVQKVGDDEMQLAEAVKQPKMIDSPVESLKEVLRLAMVKVGLRAANWPNDEEKQVLIHHIVTNYGGHTAKEISVAFDMAIAGSLNGYLLDNETVVCYENFSCLYFSSIMNAYRVWAKEAYRHAVKEPLPAIENKEEMSDKTYSDWLEQVSNDAKKGKLQLEFMPPMLYDWLHTKGSVPNFEDYLKRASIHIGRKLGENITPEGFKELAEYRAMWKSGEFTGKYVNMIPDMAKKICLWNYIFKTEK